MLRSGFTLWEKEAARGTLFTRALGARGEGARWRFSFCSVRNHSWIIPAAACSPRVVEGALGRQLWLRKEECLRLRGLRVPLGEDWVIADGCPQVSTFPGTWSGLALERAYLHSCFRLWLENTDLISTLLHSRWKCPHMCVSVCVFGVCVGTEDGAQEVVKEILEDVVTSAVKGENQAPSLSSSLLLHTSAQPGVLVVECTTATTSCTLVETKKSLVTRDRFHSPSGWVQDAQSDSVRVGCATGDAEVHAL